MLFACTHSTEAKWTSKNRDTHTPLRVCRPAGDRFEDTDPIEAEVEQVDQTHTEGSEEVKGLTDKVTTWRRQKVPQAFSKCAHKYRDKFNEGAIYQGWTEMF